MNGPFFDELVLTNDPTRRRIVLTILRGALTAVDPGPATERALRRESLIGDSAAVMVLAFGKAAPAMSRAAARVLQGRDLRGLVVSDHDEPVPDTLELVLAGHPVPDVRSLEAGRAALTLLGEADESDLVVCLISGGGSALLEVPAEGLELTDLQGVVSALLASGASIQEMNTVRKHLSAVKGGRLAQAAAPARLVTFILSDVVGNPLDVIGSGPTVVDATSFGDALEVLDRYALRSRIPARISEHLTAGARGEIGETLKAPYGRQSITIVGDGAMAAGGAAAAADRLGLRVRIATSTLSGEARRRAVDCLEIAGKGVTVFAGETTVTVAGSGRGGRNQEAALAAALDIDGDASVVFAALGTDGVDGPTAAAGAVVDGSTLERGRAAGLDGYDHLARNDSHTFLKAAGDLLVTGPTGTNVGDVWLVVAQ